MYGGDVSLYITKLPLWSVSKFGVSALSTILQARHVSASRSTPK